MHWGWCVLNRIELRVYWPFIIMLKSWRPTTKAYLRVPFEKKNNLIELRRRLRTYIVFKPIFANHDLTICSSVSPFMPTDSNKGLVMGIASHCTHLNLGPGKGIAITDDYFIMIQLLIHTQLHGCQVLPDFILLLSLITCYQTLWILTSFWDQYNKHRVSIKMGMK